MTRLIPLQRWILIGLAAAIPGSTGLLASNSVPHDRLAGAQAHDIVDRAHPQLAFARAHPHDAFARARPTARDTAPQAPIRARSNGAPVPTRTADTSHSTALFAGHSWYVPPPPPPPVAPPPPPPPSAPPFPYTFVGSYAPAGEGAVYFLARSDRVVDAHVGDHLDGVYVFESAGPEGLVFNYLPLNIRQTVTTGGSP